MQKRYFTSAFIRKGNSIVMVKHQGADDTEPYWSLPGGRVEVGESTEQAIIREVQEETGLVAHSLKTIAYQVEMLRETENQHGIAIVYDIDDWSGAFSINDPDEKVLEVAFIPVAQAIIELAKIDYLPMQVPPIAYLNGDAPAGTIYRYQVQPNHDAELLETSRH